jgi:Na+/H+-dicarboxylate symporter
MLTWILPLTVCFFIAEAIASFKKDALVFLIVLLIFEGCSNFLSVLFSYGAGHALAPFFSDVFAFKTQSSTLKPLWLIPFKIPSIWSADKGAVLGMLLGALNAITSFTKLEAFLNFGRRAAQSLLTRVFSPLAPLFVLGFVAKMHHDNTLSFLATHYLLLVLTIGALLLLYIFSLILLGNRGCLTNALRDSASLASPGFLAFSSGCSLSTMPWTIAATEKNLRQPSLAASVIPATTNIQQIGDCITNTLLVFLIYNASYGAAPSLGLWLHFSILFVLARYATAAMMGGAIFLMLPIYEKALDFTPEMLATILAFNVILDPLVTSANVVANGALCKVFENIWLMLKKKRLEKVH